MVTRPVTGTAASLVEAPAPQQREAAVQARVAELEQLLGDPRDPDNPFGHDALLAADDRSELLPSAEDALTGFGLNHEFVPEDLGGRLARVDTLARVLRPVFRRDASLALGYGVTSFLAAVAVWAAGTPEQRRWTADLLLGGGRLAIAYHELAHGNDFVRNEFTALPDGAGFRLDGRKEVINNAGRAEALVLFSRTAKEAGARSHSVLLVDKSVLPADRFEHLPRYRTVGVKGCEIGGFHFRDCPLPGDALVGGLGEGVSRSPCGPSRSPAAPSPRWCWRAPTRRCAPWSASPSTGSCTAVPCWRSRMPGRPWPAPSPTC
ncbi:alkylation response protein AidB-like acyl-CoA dehydrogenase [Streptomyces sp. SPB162]|nr:alkylation response protein AidB-like acyl-CoA dehydrogenase [Streptomyces sp. SPB162]